MSAKADTRQQAPPITVEQATRLRREIAKYSEILDSVRAIVWRAEAPSFQTTFASKQTEDILGFAAERWVREPELWKQRIHPEDVDWVLDFSTRAVQEKRKHSFEYRMLAADGRIVWLRNIVNVIVENDEPKELVGISVDITERKQAEAAKAELTGRLLRAQEEERSAIARELHDDIGQNLALLAIRLQQLEQGMEGPANERAAIDDSLRLALKIANDVERLSRGLHSSHLEHLGLAAAIRDWCGDFARHSDAKVECNLGEVSRDLDIEIGRCLFRVLQECLRNVMKHSKASKVIVNLSADSNEIRLQVCDDGVGFDPAAQTRPLGLGLVSMRERLRLVRGELSVTSAPAKGTRIEARVPLLHSG